MRNIKRPKRNKSCRLAIAGALTAAFAAGSIVSGAGGISNANSYLTSQLYCGQFNNVSAASPAMDGNAQPDIINAFGSSVETTHTIPNAQLGEALWNQERYLKDPSHAQAYNKYLSGFDRFKNQPLCEMSESVNNKVMRDIQYKNYAHSWASPAETVVRGYGICRDITTLQYAIMRYLGVPDDRLFMTLVSSHNRTDGLNHAVLLLNIAPTNATPNFVVMNMDPFVAKDSDYENGNMRHYWSQKYVLYMAQNESGKWINDVYRNTSANDPGARPKSVSLG